MFANNLTIHIYSSGTTPIHDEIVLSQARGLWFETGYPGGKSLAGGCFLPLDPLRHQVEVYSPQRVAIFSGLKMVYEGVVSSFDQVTGGGEMGVQLNFMGYWGWLMMNRRMHKRWADDRVDEQTWEWRNNASGADICTLQRDARLYFLPKSEAWADNVRAACRYISPDETIKRITFDYDLTGVAGEDWTAELYDTINASSEWSANLAGAGTTASSVDLAAPGDFTATTVFELRLQNTAGTTVTPASDGSSYLKITNMMVYTEDESGANGICLNSVASDIITAYSSVINSDTSFLDATSARTVEPFMTAGDNYEPIGDILTRIAGFGSASDGQYAVGLLTSDKAATPDGKPVLFTEDWPDVTSDYDYFLSLDDPNVIGNISITQDYGRIVNEVTVTYRDEQGFNQTITSDDDAGLADSTSQTDYGRRDAALQVGNSTSANAIDYGTRYIQRYKDPPWIVNGTISVLFATRGNLSGELVPASMVESGKLLKIDGYDTYVISRTRYDHEDQVVEIGLGEQDDLIFTESFFAPTWDDPIPGDGSTVDASTSGSSSVRTNRGGSIGILTGNEKLRKRLNRAGRGAEWQHFKRYVQRYRREHSGEGGRFKKGAAEYEKKYGKLKW